MQLLRDTLRAYALGELDFTLCGFTSADPLPGRAYLHRFLADGWHGTMTWMQRSAVRRGRPRALLPGAASVVCVAMSYHDAPEPPELAPARDRLVVARYARRKDYHKVIKRRLVRLGRRLAELRPGCRWAVAVDERPLLEKELAQRAGVGFIGKNTCLINRQLGSEVLLGELVCDVPLPPDTPERSACGACRACLDACPTGALVDGWRLDARRCISYLTIEHDGPIPAAHRRAIGSHLFGCDICQAVCPWNRRAAPSCAGPLAPRPALAALTPADLDGCDEQHWLALGAGSPLRRLDHARLQRNVAAIAANRDDERRDDRGAR